MAEQQTPLLPQGEPISLSVQKLAYFVNTSATASLERFLFENDLFYDSTAVFYYYVQFEWYIKTCLLTPMTDG